MFALNTIDSIWLKNIVSELTQKEETYDGKASEIYKKIGFRKVVHTNIIPL